MKTPLIQARALANAIFPFNVRDRIMVMFSAYFDESGTHTDSPVATVAGFLASDIRWGKFQSPWKKILDELGVDYFHMTDFIAGKKEYAGLSKEQKQKIVDRLTKAINRYATIPIAAAVEKADYKEAAL
jgi:hypothetical protein